MKQASNHSCMSNSRSAYKAFDQIRLEHYKNCKQPSNHSWAENSDRSIRVVETCCFDRCKYVRIHNLLMYWCSYRHKSLVLYGGFARELCYYRDSQTKCSLIYAIAHPFYLLFLYRFQFFFSVCIKLFQSFIGRACFLWLLFGLLMCDFLFFFSLSIPIAFCSRIRTQRL